MWAALIAAAVLTAQSDDLSTRIAQSAAAAEALQGSLDGAWVLHDRDGRLLYALQITDPAGGGPLRGAWLARGVTAPVNRITRSNGGLGLEFDGRRIRMRRRASGDWTGAMVSRGRHLAVIMRRAP